MRRHRLAVLVVCLVGLSLTAHVVASPQPRPICNVCGPSFEEALDDRGLNGTVERSTATVRIDGDGSATWTVRNRLANASTADRFREDPDLLEDVVESALLTERGLPTDGDRSVENVSASVSENGTAVITLTDPDAGRTYPGGVLLVDYFDQGGVRAGWHLTADRLSVVGPPETAVANDPGIAREADGGYDVTVAGDRVTITNTDRDAEYGPILYEEGYVAFAPDGVASGLLTTFAVAAASAPGVLGSFAEIHLLGVLVLSGLLVAGHWRGRDGDESRSAVFAWAALFVGLYIVPTLVLISPTRHYTFGPILGAGFAVYAGVLGLVALLAYPD